MWKKQRHRSSRNKKSTLISEWKKSFSKAIENEEQTNKNQNHNNPKKLASWWNS